MFKDQNLLVETVFAEDRQIEEFHKIIHKIIIADPIVKIISIEIIIRDQTQIEVNTQIIIETILIQFFETHTTLMIDKKLNQNQNQNFSLKKKWKLFKQYITKPL